MSGKLICTFCDTEVEEDTSNGPKTDSRTMLAKYNTQVGFFTVQIREYLQNVKSVFVTHSQNLGRPMYGTFRLDFKRNLVTLVRSSHFPE